MVKVRGDRMIRILLPLAMVASIFFGPMYGYTTPNPISGQEQMSRVTGDQFIKEAVDCLREIKVPLGEECAATEQIDGSTMPASVISWAAMLALAAAALGVIGILPFIGRVTSIVTILAGLGGLGAMGLFMLTMLGTSGGLPAVQWGAYLTAGASLLTVIAGLSGLRGR